VPRLVVCVALVAHSGSTAESTKATTSPENVTNRTVTEPPPRALVPCHTLQVLLSSNRDFWVAKALGAWASDERQALFYGAERALRLAFPLGAEAGAFAAAIVAAARVRQRLAGEVGAVDPHESTRTSCWLP